jgi:hydroxymethylglutaryl-CoA lyase
MKLIECPRDAIQGIKRFIPTAAKVHYLNELLQAGFDTIDFGSFVSPKAIPQMADTAEIIKQLDLSSSKSKLLAIVANERGASEACYFKEIAFIGYPFSISETFQLRNTGTTISGAIDRVHTIQELCVKHGKKLVIYLSMAFGNPYGDLWNDEIVLRWVYKLSGFGIHIFSLADTIGMANPSTINYSFNQLINAYPDLEFGAHFHTTPVSWKEKIEAAWQSGCRRFDGAILGYGGCPMAGNELVGNMSTGKLVEFMAEKNIPLPVSNQSITNLELSFKNLITY